ncbi:MAG: homocitrate synthase [Bacteroidales bacterium]|jgi:homocitrate synthase NifV|nr:homocitrate synthase [Bacteroidales bacterium]
MIWLIDSTLRDGEQAPGVAFSAAEKVAVAQRLDELGIDEIEAGIPAMGADECAVIRRIARLRLCARVSVWCRARADDIEAAAQTEAEGVHIAFPVSEIQLAVMNKSQQWIAETLPQTVEQARRHFPYVSVGAQDAGRASPDSLNNFFTIVSQCQVRRVRIADTVGVLAPLQTAELITGIRQRHPELQLDFHAHNDFGMATANAITAWQTGATALSATVNGLGERSGNAALEEIIVFLQQRFGVRKYAVNSLHDLCRYVSQVSGRPVPEMKPVSGRWACSHESGIHAHGTIASTLAFQPYDGQTVGRAASETVFGKHSGKAALVNLLQLHNRAADDRKINTLLQKIRHIALTNKTELSADDVLLLEQNEK